MKIERPFDYLNNLIGKEVVVYLKDSKIIEGELSAFDVHLNLVLQNVSINSDETKKLKGSLVRGDNLLFISEK